MNEFVYIYRNGTRPSSPEKAQQLMQRWAAWMQDLSAKGHLKDRGHPLERTGMVVTEQKTVTDGPYVEKDLVSGYTLVVAKDLAQASELAKGCPILDSDGFVEVRQIMRMD